jgi:hypothetical protein
MSSNGGAGLSSRTVVVQNVQFAQPVAQIPNGWQCWNICMDTSENGASSFYNTSSTTVVNVTNYNDTAGDNFSVYFATQSPGGTITMPMIDGNVLIG